MSPLNIKIWMKVIVTELIKRDSLNKNIYLSRSERYNSELDRLDKWIRTMMDEIPEERAKIISDHLIFGYLCDRYKIQQVGAIIPSFSSLAEPSAKEMARLEDIIQEQGVNAVFVGSSINPSLAKQLANDTGIKLVRIYTGSLGPKNSGVESYVDYMKYNIGMITEALADHGNH
jgi:ABC-type Zn uptake system ZnuABC Zn-binding protein ZnuA